MMLIRLSFIIQLCVYVCGYQLKQVIVLGRHSIRTPLVSNLDDYSRKNWPVWNLSPGYLTDKGRRIEYYMGKYFSDWLIEEQVLSDNCSKNEVFVYSNTKERTIETAKAFVEGAFGDCVKAHYKNTSNDTDQVFFPVVRNSTKAFKALVSREIEKALENIDLKEEFRVLDRILDFKNSPYCERLKLCKLENVRNDIFLVPDEQPDIHGPLSIANRVVDNFLMAYYDGRKTEEVAWGELTAMEQWRDLVNIVKLYHGLRFKTALLDKDTAKPLLEYMTDLFLSGEKKFYLLVGHDSNICSFVSSLDIEPYELHGQIEETPIGGKVVFQKWYDESNDRYLLRVNYVYQSAQQIRDGAVISMENPPQWALLKLKQCAVDNNGFCSWNVFENVLKNV